MGLREFFDDKSTANQYRIPIRNMLFSLVFMSLIDGVTTWFILISGGIEVNPIMWALMEIIGVPVAIMVSRTYYLVYLMYSWEKLVSGGVWSYRTVWFAVLFYISVISMNMYAVVRILGWLQ